MSDTNPNTEALAAVLQALVAPKPTAPPTPVRAHPDTLNAIRQLTQATIDLVTDRGEMARQSWEVDILDRHGSVSQRMRIRRVVQPLQPALPNPPGADK